MDENKDESAIKKFEDLATRLFSIAKEDIAKAEEIANEAWMNCSARSLMPNLRRETIRSGSDMSLYPCERTLYQELRQGPRDNLGPGVLHCASNAAWFQAPQAVRLRECLVRHATTVRALENSYEPTIVVVAAFVEAKHLLIDVGLEMEGAGRDIRPVQRPL